MDDDLVQMCEKDPLIPTPQEVAEALHKAVEELHSKLLKEIRERLDAAKKDFSDHIAGALATFKAEAKIITTEAERNTIIGKIEDLKKEIEHNASLFEGELEFMNKRLNAKMDSPRPITKVWSEEDVLDTFRFDSTVVSNDPTIYRNA
jgi:hypothetical protein